MNIEIQTAYQLKELIDFAYHENNEKQPWKSELYYLSLFYDFSCLKVELNTNIYLDEIDFDENENEEGYSSFVETNKLDLFCSGEIFISVITSYKQKHQSLNYNSVLVALKYYLTNDNFM